MAYDEEDNTSPDQLHEVCEHCKEKEQCLQTRSRLCFATCKILMAFLILVNAYRFLDSYRGVSQSCTETSLTGIHAHRKVESEFRWWSIYSARNDGEVKAVDGLWEALRPDHGIVAVDSGWADKNGLLPSMNLPSNTSKGVYILEAYHMLHCLKIVRKTFFQIVRGERPTYGLGHSNHCFDALRQHVMCNADDSLLYTWGRDVAGDGQLRQCRDWNVLREWASENSACFRDSDNGPWGVFNDCGDGSDGIITEIG